MKSNITYNKSVDLVGMNGPKARIVKADGSKDDLKVQLQVINPSPLEIDLGTALYEIRSGDGVKFAEIQGVQNVKRGDNVHDLAGKITGDPKEGAAHMVGVGALEDSWTKETNKFLDMGVQVPAAMVSM
jgi:hypothetical protein